MSRFYLTDLEMEALYGLRPGAWCLYVVLRRRMNFNNGEVGRKPLLSRWALREALYVEGKRGRSASDSGTPSEQTVRGYEKELLNAGLIAYRSVPEQKQLIFFLPMAETNQSRIQEVQQVSCELQQTQPQQAQSQSPQGFADEIQQEVQHPETNELQQTSENGVTGKALNPFSIAFSSSSETLVKEKTPIDDEKNNVENENQTISLGNMAKVPAVPELIGQWRLVAIQAGFSATQAGSGKAVAMYQQWIDMRVSQAEFAAAMLRAKTAVGIPNAVVYLAAIVNQVRSDGVAPMMAAAAEVQFSGDKAWFSTKAYPVGDKANAAPYLAQLKERLRYAH